MTQREKRAQIALALGALIAIALAVAIAVAPPFEADAPDDGADGAGMRSDPRPPAASSTRRSPSRFLSPDGSDAAACTRTAPCLSFARAYASARPGEVVEVAGGTYGPQVLPAVPGRKSADDVVFRGAPDAEVTTGRVTFGGPRIDDLGANHITIKGLTIAGFVTQRSRDLTFADVTVDGNFAIQGGSDVAIIGGSVGGTKDGSHPEIVAWTQGSVIDRPRRMLIDGVAFHDVQMSHVEDHVECLQVTDALDLVVRNSTFMRCDTFDLRIDRWRTSGPRGILIENNVFQRTTDRFGGNVYYGLAVRSGFDVVIRNNSSDIGWAGPEPSTRIADWLVANNAMPGGGCDERIVFRHNLWDGGEQCDPTDRLGAPSFADPRRGDFRLLPESPARDAADPENAPRFDHVGRRRDASPDIGAFEDQS